MAHQINNVMVYLFDMFIFMKVSVLLLYYTWTTGKRSAELAT